MRWRNGLNDKPDLCNYDEPKKYLVRFAADDPRIGWIDSDLMTAQEIRDCDYDDYYEWLDESNPLPPQPVPEEVELKEFAPMGEKPDEETEGLIKSLMAKKWPDNQPFWDQHRKAYREGYVDGASSVNVDGLVRALKDAFNHLAISVPHNDIQTNPSGSKMVTAMNNAADVIREALRTALAAHQSSGEMGDDQEALWEELISKVAALELFKITKPEDVEGIKKWKADKIDFFKSKYHITLKH